MFKSLPINLVGLQLMFSCICTIIAAGIPSGCPAQDAGESLFSISRLLQCSIDSIGQANGLRRGCVWLTYGCFMCHKLPCRLRKQFLLPDNKCAFAGSTLQMDVSGTPDWPSGSEQAGLTATASQLWP